MNIGTFIFRFVSSNAVQFLKFGIVGLSNTLISYVIYSGLVYVGLHYLLASVVGFIASVINAFYWNNRYVFKSIYKGKKKILFSLIKCILSYGVTGLLLQNILLYLLVDMLSISKYLAPLLILIITIPSNYLLNKFWAFKPISAQEGVGDEEN